MKKLLCTTAALIALTTTAHAESVVITPYVGFDLQRSDYNYNDDYDFGGGVSLDGNTLLENGLYGANIHVGARIGKYAGLELGYFRTKSETRNIGATDQIGTINNVPAAAGTDFSTSVKTQGFVLDGMGYYPVYGDDTVELIGTAGVSWTKAEINLSIPSLSSDTSDESEFGLRLGGGAQYNFTDKINARGLIRYQTADFESIADNAWIGSVGLNYSF